MEHQNDCGMLGKGILGDPNCKHDWNWSGEVITTAPAKQHRRCKLCGRRECVSICKIDTAMDECQDPKCHIHGQPPAPPVQEEKGLVLKNGILRYT